MSVTRPVVKTEALKKQKSNQPGYQPAPGKWPIRKVVLSPGRKQWDLGGPLKSRGEDFKNAFQTFQFRLNFNGTKTQFAEIFNTDIHET